MCVHLSNFSENYNFTFKNNYNPIGIKTLKIRNKILI